MENEIFDYLNNKLNDCVPFKHDDYDQYINYMYSENLCRLKKMNELYGKKDEYFLDDNYVCLFQQDLKKKCFYINYKEVISFLKSKYNISNDQIEKIYRKWFYKNVRLNEYKITLNISILYPSLDEYDKMKYINIKC